VDARALVEDEVRELVRRRGLDPVAAPQQMQQLVSEVVADYDERAATSTLPPIADPDGVARSVYDAVAGFGPLQRYLDDPEVEELWINEPATIDLGDLWRPGLHLGVKREVGQASPADILRAKIDTLRARTLEGLRDDANAAAITCRDEDSECQSGGSRSSEGASQNVS
jgi:hypothetical protein